MKIVSALRINGEKRTYYEEFVQEYTEHLEMQKRFGNEMIQPSIFSQTIQQLKRARQKTPSRK